MRFRLALGYLGVGLIGLIIGFIDGREYLKHELRSAFSAAAGDFKKTSLPWAQLHDCTDRHDETAHRKASRIELYVTGVRLRLPDWGMAAMIRRLLVTGVLLIAALGGFWGLADGKAGLFSPFGWLFIVFAAAAWHKWRLVSGAFSPGLFDGMCSRDDGAYRADDDHYRRDGQRNYREPQ